MRLRKPDDFPLSPAIAAAILASLTACQNVPTHEDIMFYNRQYELRAAREIAGLRARANAGEITESTYESEAEEIIETAPEDAMEALYRHHVLNTRTAPAPPVR